MEASSMNLCNILALSRASPALTMHRATVWEILRCLFGREKGGEEGREGRREGRGGGKGGEEIRKEDRGGREGRKTGRLVKIQVRC